MDRLAARAEFFFSSKEAQAAMGVSPDATKVALHRLSQQGMLASPARGLHLIVPPEYRSLGCLPAPNFIPELMKRLKLTYYVGLLSAAQYYGAAHQRPQEFQVFLERNRRPIRCGQVRVAFFARKRLAEVAVQSFNTPYDAIRVSSPEATAVDLLGYPHRAGGLNNVATVLSELAEHLDPDKLSAAAATAPIAWAQRLGYLLDHLGANEKTGPLSDYVRVHVRNAALLQPRLRQKRAQRDQKWRLDINTEVESDL